MKLKEIEIKYVRDDVTPIVPCTGGDWIDLRTAINVEMNAGDFMIIPGVLDITVIQGATFNPIFTYSINGLPVNLTGYTARMQIRPSVDSDTILATLTTENGGILITPLAGQIQLLMSATQTSALSFVVGVYDLEIITGVSVDRLLQGQVILSKEVTR